MKEFSEKVYRVPRDNWIDAVLKGLISSCWLKQERRAWDFTGRGREVKGKP